MNRDQLHRERDSGYHLQKKASPGVMKRPPTSGGQHHSGSHDGHMMIWLIVDGVGLCLITACTLLDAMVAWHDNFSKPLTVLCSGAQISCVFTDLTSALFFWASGRFLQVIGLFMLIAYAASFQYFTELERSGMLMLTVGPCLNIVACLLFEAMDLQPTDEVLKLGDVDLVYRPIWLATELNELLGILILDISMMDMGEYKVLAAEVVGFTILGGAALIEYYSPGGNNALGYVMRHDIVHLCDAIGLFMLTLVGIAHCRAKVCAKKQHGGANLTSESDHHSHHQNYHDHHHNSHQV